MLGERWNEIWKSQGTVSFNSLYLTFLYQVTQNQKILKILEQNAIIYFSDIVFSPNHIAPMSYLKLSQTLEREYKNYMRDLLK